MASAGDSGALYGTFHLLRLLSTATPIQRLDVREKPRHQVRILNHWDNLDGSIERGYGGRSLWKWEELPATIDPRLHDYARANVSIGLNGTVINSVNANPKSLTADYIAKAAAIADVFRPYGLKVYLSANFAAPRPDRRPRHRRPARSGRAAVVEGQGERDLQGHPRLRRLHRQGQQRGPARPAGLQAHATPTAPTCSPMR